ncbi:MAG: FtsX-like permease family protein [Acidobacteria bacterium]|nr:FtsX-like permease family protein [Acidobacteriota bacterium]
MAAASFVELFRLAWDSFSQNRLRTALAVLGLTMGVATLIGVMTLIQGANAYVGDKVAGLGTGVFRIAKRSFDVTNLEEYYSSQRNPDITYDDFLAVREGCGECDAVGATITARVKARRGGLELSDVNLEGQSYEMADVSTRTVERGRYFTLGEQRRAAAVCVIGADVAERLFPGVDPLERSLRIDREPLKVIGVYERVGSVLGQNQDSFAVVPLETFRQMRGLRQSLTIEASAGDGPRFQRAQDQARVILRARRNIGPRDDENFYIGTADTYIALWQTISASFVFVFGGVSTIAGLVGGIVIMNMMLVSVAQRTREIGVRRACGARRSDIRRQFLTESVLQCLLGGALGVAGGVGGAWLLRRYADFPADLQWWTAALGVGYAAAIGLFFGIYPAIRAAALDPVEALREDR